MTTLVVTDLDGTLWDTTLTCHSDTLAAVHQLLADPDVELLVATGRRRNSARRAFALNGIELPSVLLNGAIGFDFAADSIFHQVTFDAASLRNVVDVLQAHQLAPVAYMSDTQALVVEGATTSLRHLDSLGDDLVWGTFDDLLAHTEVLGMSMLGIEESLVAPAFSALGPLLSVEAAAYADHLYAPFSLMLAPSGVTKELGIRAYLDHAGIEPDRIVALGDGGNDLEMLAMADTALVTQGGDARALALADHVIERPDHGGWAAVLNHV